MHFNQDLLNQKLQQLIRMQNNPEYKPAKDVLKLKAKEEKDRVRAENKIARARQQAEAKAKKEAARKAKDVMLARKLKRLDESEGAKPKVDYTIGSKSSSRQKPLANRDLHLDEMIPVHIDSKTVVFVKPGTDIKAIRAKYKPEPLKFDDESSAVRKKTAIGQIDNDEIRKLVAMNTPVKHIAKMLDVRPSSIKKAIKYLGL
jgi:hypothetical protein